MKFQQFFSRKRLFVMIGLLGLVSLLAVLLWLRLQANQPLAHLNEAERAWLAEHKDDLEILNGYIAAPEYFYNEDGEYVGFMIDYLHEIEKRLGVQFKHRRFETWHELIEYAKTHQNFVILGISESEARREYFSFSNDFLKVPNVIISQIDNDYQSLDNLTGTTVCTVRGYIINDYLDQYYPYLTVRETPDDVTGLRDVATGQCDVMLIGQIHATYYIQDQALVNLKVSGEVGYYNKHQAAVSVKDPILYNIIGKTIDQIPTEIQRDLYQKWLNFGANTIQVSERTVSVLTGIVVSVTAVFIVMWVWSTSLQSTVKRQTAQIRDDYEKLKVAEAELRISEEKFRGIIEQSNDAIYVLYENTLEVVNDKFLELFAISHAEIAAPGFDPITLVAPEHRDYLRSLVRRAAQGEEVETQYEYYGVKTTGEKIVLEASVNRIPYKDGIASQGVLRNVTERRNREAQRRQSQKMEAVGRLAGGVAHDFNNLLTIINGHAELALMNLEQSHPLHRRMAHVQKAGGRAAALTRQLLTFSRKQVMQPQIINVNDLINDLKSMLNRLIRADIVVQFNPESDVGQIKADPGQIEQVVMNLVLNAQDAMPDGGSLTIETANVYLDKSSLAMRPHVEAGSYVMISVRDTGVGMDEETLSHIFEPFFSTKGLNGTGLGLATSYGIIERSKGHISVQSELNKGTIFKVYLPSTQEISQLLVNTPLAEDDALFGTETVLVVEDEAAVRDLVVQVLQRYGYTVLVAENGRIALHTITTSTTPIDLIITDVIMPEMSGAELVAALSDEMNTMRILMMSGYTDNVIADDILERIKHFIEKPFSPLSLVRRVRTILNQEQ